MRRLAKPVRSYRVSEGSNPSLSASARPARPRPGRQDLERTTMAARDTALGTARTALLGLALLAAGCAAERELLIVSDPPGALVRLDDEAVGLTPYKEEFQAYGTRRVTLYRPGYRTSSKRVVLDPPWYARFPIDIFSEVLLPFGWEDHHRVHVVLEPESGEVTLPALERVLERAERLRLAGPEGPRPVAPAPEAPEGSASEPRKPEKEDLP